MHQTKCTIPSPQHNKEHKYNREYQECKWKESQSRIRVYQETKIITQEY